MRYRIELYNSSVCWYKNWQYHRLHGPSVENVEGYRAWWKNGQRYRLGGPARELPDGYKAWWIDGKKYSEEEFNKLISK